MDFPSTQVLDDNDSSSSRSSESLQKTPKRIYQVATLTVGNKKYPIFEGINKVGRHSDNDICINDHNVSMYHAEIEADAKHAFICDLRSTNKTRMNDEKLKPDRFYQLLDGAKLTFGILNGTYLRLRDDESIIIPSTPEPGLKLRKNSNKNSSKPNTSSTADSDDSVVLGTQEAPEDVFVKPLVPNHAENITDTSNNVEITTDESNKSIYEEETQRINKPIGSLIFVQKYATRLYASNQSDKKRINTNNKQKSKRNIVSEESGIFEKETQKFGNKNNDIDESQILTQKLAHKKRNEQIYDVETQKILVDQQVNDFDNVMTQKFYNKKINDLETQKQNELESQDSINVYNMATQRFQPLNIKKEKTEIYDIETQHLTEKSNKLKNKNVSTKILNAPSQKVEVVKESDRDHEQDGDTNMVLRSHDKSEKIMTINKKVCINNSFTNIMSNNASQKLSGFTTNDMAVETTPNSSTLISSKSCLIVAETDDESETDDEGVFSNFLQKKNSNVIHNINNTYSECIDETNLNNEDLNDEVHSSYKNCASPVLVNFDEIPESIEVKNKNSYTDDSDNEMYMTPKQIMSPIKSNIHLSSNIAVDNLSKKKLHSNSEMNFYNDEPVTQLVVPLTQVQENGTNKNNILEATQSMIATQVLIETQKIALIENETNFLETQILDTQRHEVNNFKSSKRERELKHITQSVDTQILETQSIDEFSKSIDKNEKINNSVESLQILKKTKNNQSNHKVDNTFQHKIIFDDNDDEEKNKNSNNNHNGESRQLIELENDIRKKNTLDEQESQVDNEMNEDCDMNEKRLKTLKLKKQKRSNDCIEWRINSSCRVDCDDFSFHKTFKEISKTEDSNESIGNNEEINDTNGYLSSEKIENKDQKYTSKIPISTANKINSSLNQNTKNGSKNSEDNDVVLNNLDNMFGEVANGDMVEPTQLLTQQLVDILQTPEKSCKLDTVVNNIDKFQKFGAHKSVKGAQKTKEETLGNCSSVDEESQELYFAHLNSKKKRKTIFDTPNGFDSERSSKYQKNSSDLNNDESCLSGFVDGVAVVCKKSNYKGLQDTINHKKTNDDDDDDILLGLPEVNLNGVGLSPCSPTSLNSSDEDIQNNEKIVLKQPQVASKMSNTKKSILSIQCDNTINDNKFVARKQVGTVAMKFPYYDDKGKLSPNSEKHTRSDKKIEIDQEKMKKVQEKEKKIESQISKSKPIFRKRTASCDLSQSLIESKKKRPVVKLDSSLNISMRQEYKRKSFRAQKYSVIFTGISAENYIEPIKSIGGTVTEEPSKANILVTDKVRRTYKFICAISKSIPIVSIRWIDECIKKDEFLNPDEYILKDQASEIKFDFELSETLKKSSEGLLLQGYTCVITPKVVNPSIKDLKDMIQVAGGKSLIRMPRVWTPNIVIIGCDADIPKIKEIVKKIPKNITVPVVTTEFIFSGILKQKLEPEVHRLY